ncbi:hypothetical protein [Paraburkholderia sp. 32]|uniref:hypothetical protein n=1 Tax=Paraburkholderia sp. 32 TaxID=2991057 RepID=UPI003D1F87B0
MKHVLEDNEQESNYFSRLNKNGKAAYRRSVSVITGGLPSWAARAYEKVVTESTAEKVVTKSDEPRVDLTKPLRRMGIELDDLRTELSAQVGETAARRTLSKVDAAFLALRKACEPVSEKVVTKGQTRSGASVSKSAAVEVCPFTGKALAR